MTALDGEISPNELRGDNVILDDKMYAMPWYLTGEHLDFGEPVASIGYPSSEGPVVRAITRFGITKQCEVPEGAWEFITLVLDEQYAKFEELAALDSTSFADLNYLPCTYAAYEKYTECFTNCRQYVRFHIRMDESNTYEIGAYNLVGVKYLTDEEKKLLDAKSQRELTEAEVARLAELMTEQRAK